jgi:hypothetical protein
MSGAANNAQASATRILQPPLKAAVGAAIMSTVNPSPVAHHHEWHTKVAVMLNPPTCHTP